MLKHFIFGSDIAPAKTYEELLKERELAERELARLAGAYTTDPVQAASRLGAEIGTLIRGAIINSKLKQMDAKGASLFKELMGQLMGSTSSSALNAGSSKSVWRPGAIEWKPADLSPKPQGTKPSKTKFNLDPEFAKKLVKGAAWAARSLGVTPQDILAIASYESAGTFNPSIKGPKTKYGRPVGLFQFLPENAAKYGYDPNDPDSQFRALVQYALDRGYKPGMGVERLYATINAGSPDRLNARDAAQGGAPGTVLEKVKYQFGPHYQKAMSVIEIAKAAGVDPDKLASKLGVSKNQTFNLADAPTRMAMEQTIQALGGESEPVREAGNILPDETKAAPDPRTSGNWMPKLPPIPAPPPAPEITPPAQREQLYSTFMKVLQRINESPFLSSQRKEILKQAISVRLEALNQRFKAEDMNYQAWKDAYKEYYSNLVQWARNYNEMLMKARLNPMQVAPGQVVYDPITRKPLYRAPDKLTELERMVAIENERRKALGLPLMTPFEMKLILQQAGSTKVNVNTAEGADEAARKALISKTIDTYKPLLEFAQEAPLFEARLNALDELLRGQNTGGIPGHLRQKLAEWGFGSSRDQAIVGIINWLVPRLRAPGMGVLNESEYQMLHSTLPMLTRSPEANQVMMRLLKAEFDLKRSAADLLRKFQLGEIDYRTMLDQMAKLRDEKRRAVENDIIRITGLASRLKGSIVSEPTENVPEAPIDLNNPPPDAPDDVKEVWPYMTPEEREEVLRRLQ